MQIESILIAGGAVNVVRGKCNEHGNKHYHAGLQFGLHRIKDNAKVLRKKFKKSSDAIDYGNRFVNRFRSSFDAHVEMQDGDIRTDD